MARSPAGSAQIGPAKIGSAKIGLIVEIAGASAFLGGAVLSIHHYAIALLTIGGAAAFFIGKKLRATAGI